MRHDPPARRRHVVAARGRQGPHRRDDRLVVLLLEALDGLGDVVRRQHFASRGIHPQNHRLHVPVLRGEFQLVLDRLGQAAADRLAGAHDDALHRDDRDLLSRGMALDGDLLQAGPRGQWACAGQRQQHSNDVESKQAKKQQSENDRCHSPPGPFFLFARRTGSRGRRAGSRTRRYERRRDWRR